MGNVWKTKGMPVQLQRSPQGYHIQKMKGVPCTSRWHNCNLVKTNSFCNNWVFKIASFPALLCICQTEQIFLPVKPSLTYLRHSYYILCLWFSTGIWRRNSSLVGMIIGHFLIHLQIWSLKMHSENLRPILVIYFRRLGRNRTSKL
jgi:hypothetical protein